MGSLESWLLLRSLRTMHLRIPRQSTSGTEIAQWLYRATLVPEGQKFDGIPGSVVTKVWHSSLQGTDERGFNPTSQMEGGYNATFSILVRSAGIVFFLVGVQVLTWKWLACTTVPSRSSPTYPRIFCGRSRSENH